MQEMRAMVEYNFTDTPYGRRAMNMSMFTTLEKAKEFAKEHADAEVYEFDEVIEQ